MVMPQDQDEWDKAVAMVTRAMCEHVAPFTTPLSKILSEKEGKLLGSASYMAALGQTLLITNDHNLVNIERTGIGAQFYGNDQPYRVHQAISSPYPFDVGVSRTPHLVWNDANFNPHQASAIPLGRFAPAHAPVDNEVLFFKGYAWQGSKFYFDNLFTTGTCYCVKQVPLPDWDREEKLEERFHFALDYRPDLATSLKPGYSLPRPDGFSGSLVWNTHYVEAVTQGAAWKPEYAEVTGIVWGWPSSAACLVATKVEHVRSCLLNALGEMQARGDITVT